MNATGLFRNRKTGKVILDGKGLYEIPYTFLTNVPNNSISVSAGRQAGPYAISVSQDGPGIIRQFAVQSTSNSCGIKFQLQDGAGQRWLMNAHCHMGALFGSGTQPYYLPEGLYLDEGHVLSAFLSDFSGSSNSIRLHLRGKRLRKPVDDPTGALARDRLNRRQYTVFPYWYTFDTGGVGLTAAGTSNQTIQISNEGHFELVQISAVSTGNFNIDIYNQATGESIICAPMGQHYEVPHTLLCGTNNYPFKLHEPWFIGAGQKIVVALTDTHNSGTNTVHLVLGGRFIRTGDAR